MKEQGDNNLGQMQGYQQTYNDGARRYLHSLFNWYLLLVPNRYQSQLQFWSTLDPKIVGSNAKAPKMFCIWKLFKVEESIVLK